VTSDATIAETFLRSAATAQQLLDGDPPQQPGRLWLVAAAPEIAMLVAFNNWPELTPRLRKLTPELETTIGLDMIAALERRNSELILIGATALIGETTLARRQPLIERTTRRGQRPVALVLLAPDPGNGHVYALNAVVAIPDKTGAH
jgi:hypothetical protein